MSDPQGIPATAPTYATMYPNGGGIFQTKTYSRKKSMHTHSVKPETQIKMTTLDECGPITWIIICTRSFPRPYTELVHKTWCEHLRLICFKMISICKQDQRKVIYDPFNLNGETGQNIYTKGLKQFNLNLKIFLSLQKYVSKTLTVTKNKSSPVDNRG